MATATKTTTEVDAWAEVAQAGLREGAIINVADSIAATLHIDVALSSTTAHTGTEVIVEVGTDTSDATDNWSVRRFYICCVGTAVTLALDATEPIGETVIAVTNPVTANMDNDKKFKFIEDTGTEANSEIVYQTANSGDAGDTVTIGRGGLAHEQNTGSILWDIDNAVTEVVSQVDVPLLSTDDRVRILYNNNFDPDGSTVFCRARITKVTSIG